MTFEEWWPTSNAKQADDLREGNREQREDISREAWNAALEEMALFFEKQNALSRPRVPGFKTSLTFLTAAKCCRALSSKGEADGG